jgi:opacity protein-like surface antigen
MTFHRLIVLLLLVAASSSLQAQRFNQQREFAGLRDGTWEASLLLGSQDGLEVSGENGSSVDIDSKLGWGLAFGWNWTPNWNFSYRFMLAKPDYTAVIVPEDSALPAQTLNYSAERYSNQINAAYHFFDGPLTPYLQAGIGYAKLDSNVPSAPPDVACWWDPWYGYICFSDWSTYDSSGFSYNLGLGLRWDVNGALFMRGAWNREFFSGDRADFDFDTLTLELGLMW